MLFVFLNLTTSSLPVLHWIDVIVIPKPKAPRSAFCVVKALSLVVPII